MELGWFEALLFGLISGFTEVLPVSSLAHQTLFFKLAGGEAPILRIFARIGTLAAIFTVFLPMIARLRRERKLANLSKKRRRRQPDVVSMMELRLLRVAMISSLAVLLLYPVVHNLYERLWLLAILVAISGIVVYIPQFLPGANKQAQTMSSLDGMLMGIGSGLGVIPGFSRVGLATSVGMIRGTQRQYAADLAVLMAVPALVVMLILDAFTVTGVPFTALVVFNCATTMAAAFAAAWMGLSLLKFMAFRVGFSGFAYYSWGFALFALLIYLI